ncbi:MAG: MBL fold metallo-hydrolase [Pirellulaceae bacterium]|jgi:metallo-beta-lactamase family protein|nr:MBL fold metallo-hydrolase [Pirellulaceae bacterium]
MKLHFLGANQQVTGSRYCLETESDKLLIDCGMFQERPYLDRNWLPSPVRPQDIRALVLTHVHVDHCGLIPRLVNEGFRGPIFCTHPSVELAEVILRDAARIQSEDVRFKKKRHDREGRRGRYPELALFTETDVEKTLPLLEGIAYGQPVTVAEGVTVTFHDAGHILGSAMLEFRVRQPQGELCVIFSGDIGQWGKPLLRDPTLFTEADYVVMESTYGDRDHNDHGAVEDQLEQIVQETLRRGGNLVIPVFAVERAQELVYHLARLVHGRRIPRVDTFLDSPMATDVTAIFRKYPECFDAETWALITANEPPLRFPGLQLVRGVAESKAINDRRAPSIIMAPSGMCTAGRIKHHLRQNVGRAESTILFVGYQAQGTLGRQLLDGHPFVRIHGREWKVRAQVRQLDGVSGHADRAALLRWIGHLRRPPQHVFLTHGDADAAAHLAGEISTRWGWPTAVPTYQQQLTLSACPRPSP